MTREEKRTALRQRVTQAKGRLEGRPVDEVARELAGGAVDYAKRNPILVIGGAAVVGIVLGGLTGKSRKALASGGIVSRIVSDAAIAFALSMYEKATERAEIARERVSGLVDHSSDIE